MNYVYASICFVVMSLLKKVVFELESCYSGSPWICLSLRSQLLKCSLKFFHLTVVSVYSRDVREVLCLLKFCMWYKWDRTTDIRKSLPPSNQSATSDMPSGLLGIYKVCSESSWTTYAYSIWRHVMPVVIGCDWVDSPHPTAVLFSFLPHFVF